MESINIFFTVISPYTAFLPMVLMTIRVVIKKHSVLITPWNFGLLFLFSWSMLVGVLNKNFLSSAASFALLFYFFMSVYFQNFYNVVSKIEKLLKSTAIFSLFSVVIGFIEKFTVKYFGSIHWGYFFGIPITDMVRDGYRIYGTFGNPNVAGTWYSAVILLCFYFYDNEEGLKKYFYGAGIVLFTWALILTGSRGAALGLILGLTSYGFLRGIKKNTGLLLLIISCVVVLMLLPPEWLPWVHTSGSSMNHGLERSVTSRWEIWESSLKMFAMKPVTGWGLMGIYFAGRDIFEFSMREPHAHNIWITVATTLGIVGLAVYLYMRFHILKGIILLLNRGCRLAPLLAGMQAAAIGHGLVDFTPMTPQGGIIFFGCSALICALSYTYSGSKTVGIYLPSLNLVRNRAA